MSAYFTIANLVIVHRRRRLLFDPTLVARPGAVCIESIEVDKTEGQCWEAVFSVVFTSLVILCRNQEALVERATIHKYGETSELNLATAAATGQHMEYN